MDINTGDKAFALVPMDKVLVFDSESGRRL